MSEEVDLRYDPAALATRIQHLESLLKRLRSELSQLQSEAEDEEPRPQPTPSHPRKPLLTVEQILTWARAHQARTGQWPQVLSGPILEAPGETWKGINIALHSGRRGLPRSSLSRLLQDHRGDVPWARRQLTVAQVLDWADAWKERTGQYPMAKSGPIPEAPGLSWTTLDHALRHGRHQLPSGSSLSRLLREHRSHRRLRRRLTIAQILMWAKAWRARTGRWPTARSGPIPEEPGLNWSALNQALRHGSHGLPAGSSLSRLFQERRGKKRYEQRGQEKR